jgi:agmatine deiminase
MMADGESNCVVLATLLKERHPRLFEKLQKALRSHGIEVRLIDNVRDIWLKDFSPIQVGPGELAKFRYDPSYLRDEPRLRTGEAILKSFRSFGHCHRSPIILDGGNVVASRTKAIVTDKIFKENPGWSPAALRDKLHDLLQIDQLIVIPKEPYDPMGHADGMVRFINEEALLVNDYSGVDPRFGDRLVKVFEQHKLDVELLPYAQERKSRDGIPSAVGCYVNFLHTENVIAAPVFGRAEDDDAREKLEAVFAGVPIVPLDSTDVAREGGSINCISATFHVTQGS